MFLLLLLLLLLLFVAIVGSDVAENIFTSDRAIEAFRQKAQKVL